MVKAMKMASVVLILIVILTLGISSVASASNYEDNVGNLENPGMGPAPNFGDGVPDGPGW